MTFKNQKIIDGVDRKSNTILLKFYSIPSRPIYREIISRFFAIMSKSALLRLSRNNLLCNSVQLNFYWETFYCPKISKPDATEEDKTIQAKLVLTYKVHNWSWSFLKKEHLYSKTNVLCYKNPAHKGKRRRNNSREIKMCLFLPSLSH